MEFNTITLNHEARNPATAGLIRNKIESLTLDYDVLGRMVGFVIYGYTTEKLNEIRDFIKGITHGDKITFDTI